jgi:hypothetical protein
VASKLSTARFPELAQLNMPKVRGRAALTLPTVHSASLWKNVIPKTGALLPLESHHPFAFGSHDSIEIWSEASAEKIFHHRVPASAAMGKVNIDQKRP